METGFVLAQLFKTAYKKSSQIPNFFVNTAPRMDDKNKRENNEGEEFVILMIDTKQKADRFWRCLGAGGTSVCVVS